jgi:hypothetical protein
MVKGGQPPFTSYIVFVYCRTLRVSIGIRDSVAGAMTRLRGGRSGVRISIGTNRFFSSLQRSDRLWVPPKFLFNGHWSYFPGVNRRRCEVNNSWHPPSAEVNEWGYTSTSPIRVHDANREILYLITFSRFSVVNIIL